MVLMRKSNFEIFYSCYVIATQLITIFNAEEPSAKWKNLRCYAICVAGCVKKNEVLKTCESNCRMYAEDNKICNANDVLCWERCDRLIISAGKELNRPTGLSNNYQQVENPNPKLVQLQWNHDDSAIVYMVEYQEIFDGEISDWGIHNVRYLIAINSSITFHKPNMCPVYEYRVASVNEFGVSNFSQAAQIPAPIPYVQNISLRAVRAQKKNEPFFDPVMGHGENESITLDVEFNPPIGWNLSAGDYAPHFQHFMQECQKPQLAGTAEATRPFFHGESMATFRFPLSRLTDQCNELVELTQLVSRCNTEFEYSNSESFKKGSSMILFRFNCSSVIDSQCLIRPKSPKYECFVDDMVAIYNASESILNVRWSALKTKPGEIKPDYYDYIINRVELPFNNILDKPINPEIMFNSSVVADNVTFGVTFQIPFNVSTDHAYYLQVCQGYTGFTKIEHNWRIASKFLVNINDAYSVQGGNRGATPSGKGVGSPYVPLVSGLLAVVGLLGAVAFFILFWRWKNGQNNKVKAKSIDQLRLGRFTGSESEDDDSRYVMPPRRFDHWELSRKRLIIYEDQKLGSGAFGAVYKGKITGKLLSHANSNSVLAENWMKSENCDAAVKMLPNYADELSKSEFMKEIGLMKTLGYHHRLVNMLCCVTADDPLCLVVEYCSEGDLLHYLRDRRKYMIKLEEANIDMNESEDVDMNMILCLKDLISFAWQISTGMEYLSQKGLIHRDLAARNILVDKGKKAKIGDFGLCRYSNTDSIYVSKGGRLPLKWMAIEAIKTYEFTVKSDIWSFGVLLFEIITLGGSPYPGVQPADTEALLDSGKRMDQPENCSDELYEIMLNAWDADPEKRCHFDQISAKLRHRLENLTEDYMYMSLNKKCDYYNFGNKENCDATDSRQLSLSDNRYPKSRDPQDCAHEMIGFSNPTFTLKNQSKFDKDLKRDESRTNDDFVEVELNSGSNLDSQVNNFKNHHLAKESGGKLGEMAKFFKTHSHHNHDSPADILSNGHEKYNINHSISEQQLIK